MTQEEEIIKVAKKLYAVKNIYPNSKSIDDSINQLLKLCVNYVPKIADEVFHIFNYVRVKKKDTDQSYSITMDEKIQKIASLVNYYRESYYLQNNAYQKCNLTIDVLDLLTCCDYDYKKKKNFDDNYTRDEQISLYREYLESFSDKSKLINFQKFLNSNKNYSLKKCSPSYDPPLGTTIPITRKRLYMWVENKKCSNPLELITLVHEFEHVLDFYKRGSFDSEFDELPAILNELYFCDFLCEKRHNDLYSLKLKYNELVFILNNYIYS